MTSSCALDQVRWSEMDYDMKEFVQMFGDQLPILCQTTTGYAGCDDDIHQVAADEVYWIYAMQRQSRIVAVDKNRRYISIPVDNCKYRFQIIEDNKKKSPLVTSADLLTRLKENPSTRIQFQFEQDRRVSYQVGADVGNATQFGILELQESYDEKYLLGFGLHSGHVYARTCGIPVYIDVSLTRAIGLNAEEKDNGEKFRKWLEELRKLCDSQEKTAISTCQAIIVFPERPSNGDYEYIRPCNFLRETSKQPDKTHTQSDTGKAENEYSYIVTLERSFEPPATDAHSSTGRPRRTDEIIRVPIPQIPRRSPPRPSSLPDDEPPVVKAPQIDPGDAGETPPPIPLRNLRPGFKRDNPTNWVVSKPDLATNIEENSSPSENECNDVTARRPPGHQYYSYEDCKPGIDPVEAYTPLSEVHSDHPSQENQSDCPSHDPSEIDSSRDDSSRNGNRVDGDVDLSPGLASDHPPPIPPLSQKYTNPVAKTTTKPPVHVTDTCSRLARYVTAAQVPSDENAEDWTVSDVIEALRLLKMNEYGKLFRERDVDGALLCCLDENTLVNDFGFKLFEATKFVMFVRKGWRPK